MAVYSGVGVIQPPLRSPIAELRRIYGGDLQGDPVFIEQFERFIEQYEILATQAWALYFQQAADAAGSGGGGSGVYYDELTPADNVVPTLEVVARDGTLGLLLDRTTTTIDPATLSGGVPTDGYEFKILIVQDSTGGRDLVWDPAYIGANETQPAGDPDCLNIYNFLTVGGVFLLNGAQIGLLP